MIRMLMIAAIVIIGLTAGCKKQPQQTPQPQTTQKTEEQMRQEAQKDITQQNLDQQVDKMEKEINADTQAQ
ncbi:MAG: hypothetical protein LLF76_14405 [Planctomycetaceae bacterium]|nr:hypothetical protein [Planctomycetaceae bacterium]